MGENEASHAPKEPKKELLYHYTTQAGLLGILEEKSIWATHINHLNDASELKRGLEIVRRHVEQFKIDPLAVAFDSSSEFVTQIIETTLRSAVGQALKIIDQMDVFVASFFDSSNCSTDRTTKDAGDVLEQWRAYSGDRTGISIGFDKEILSDHIADLGENPNAPIAHGICNYDQNFQEKFLQDRVAELGPLLLQPFSAIMSEYKTNTLPEIIEDLKRDLTSVSSEQLIERMMSRVALDLKNRLDREKENYTAAFTSQFVHMVIPPVFMKHQAFEAENEWRIAEFNFGTISQVRFRPGTFSLVPYVAIPLPLAGAVPDLIKRIVVGPSPKMDDAVAAVKMFLISKGYKVKDQPEAMGIEVAPSQIPYRNW